MSKLSRRRLAVYAANQLLDGATVKRLSQQLAAELVASRRMNEAGLLADDIAWELEDRGKFASGKVTSAHQLSPALRKQLLTAVKQAAQVEAVEIEELVDPAVLGGLHVETAIHSWDETIARRLNDLRGVI